MAKAKIVEGGGSESKGSAEASEAQVAPPPGPIGAPKVVPDAKARPSEAEKLGLPFGTRILGYHKYKDGSRHVEYKLPGEHVKRLKETKGKRAADLDD